ncbi:acyltransferase family protein [Bisgaard Taxon 10/6]|uniref:acyltransferase n=1 Tax=Exercitatus varius TaxID=67857 RepID=UPI00294B9493|nr:acyltransferase family protein [Exercitatus varius]MDG2917704.1 acyltransferase family protein [Exercitatus varius]
MSGKANSRVIYFDILNILACFAVLVLHHNGIVHNYNVNTLAWKQALVFEVLFYWAVPIFFMLTGATLFTYREKYSTRVFFMRRFSRAVVPFLIWSCIFYFYGNYTDLLPIFSFPQFIDSVFNTRNIPFIDVYWFFIHLFSLYMIIPVLSLLKDNVRILIYIVAMIFITHSVFPLLFQFLGVYYNWAIIFPMAGYSIYLILGYLCSKINLNGEQRLLIYILGIISLLIRYYGTYYLSLSDGVLNRTFFSYMYFHTVFLAMSIFVFIKYELRLSSHPHLISIIRNLSSCSLGIYLIHKFIMDLELNMLHTQVDNVYWRFLGAFMTYGICLIVVMLGKRIPYLRVIFP